MHSLKFLQRAQRLVLTRFTTPTVSFMSVAKKAKMTKTIGTHSGAFHADESLAVFMLKQLPEFKDADLVRSRDMETLDKCDIVVDVSGQYDGTKYFDHHQRGFEEIFDLDGEFVTKLSSAGLVYKHFGKDVIRAILKDASVSDADIDLLYRKIYKDFVEAIDANDNGIEPYSEPIAEKPKFKQFGITLPALVSTLNGLVKEESERDAQFNVASQLMGTAFHNLVYTAGTVWLPARAKVLMAVEAALKNGDEQRYLEFDESCQWKDHLFTIEEEKGIEGRFLYVLYPTPDSVRVQAVNEKDSAFKSRKPLPEEWRGLRDEELSEKSGIPGGVFVHAAGFIGGNKTLEGALEMAKKGALA
ncbi:uncharacterized protein YALI1_D33105g [Yarrowia lipolytica]|nr:hypothetical protein YALI1_D33105g [Yarrowia lipolytica]